jgi:hypothetical protein
MTDPDNLCIELSTFLQQLENEIESFSTESKIWERPAGINNSPGNITLHIMGNLQHWIGAFLLDNNYKRNRPLEFSSDPIARNELLTMLKQTRIMIEQELPPYLVLHKGETYPQPFDNKTISLYGAITHLIAHLGYHCGQINYFRKLLDSK